MNIPKSPMPRKEKIMKKIKKVLDKQGEIKPKVNLEKLATELSDRRGRSLQEEQEENQK